MRAFLRSACTGWPLLVIVAGCGTRTELSLGPSSDADIDAATDGRTPSCAPEDAFGRGPCYEVFGYRWDGTRCVVVGGCTCTGAACEQRAQTPEACEAAHEGAANFRSALKTAIQRPRRGGMSIRSPALEEVRVRRSCLLVAFVTAACGPTRTSRPRPRPPSLATTTDAGVDASKSAAVPDEPKGLTDAELAAWLREGCGPIETTPESSALTSVDPKLAKLSSAGSVFGAAAKGTIVHARAGELWLVSADGGRRRRLVRQAEPDDEPIAAQWVDDGRAVTFETRYGDKRGRRVVLGARCESARVVQTGSTPRPCDGVSPDGRLCLTREDPWFTLTETANGKTATVAAPTRDKMEHPQLEHFAWTANGSTLYLVARFRGSVPIVDKGEPSFAIYDGSGLYRLRLPKPLTQQTKPLQVESLPVGDFNVYETTLRMAPDDSALLWLQGFGYHATRAEVTWLRLPGLTRMDLGSHHKLVGGRSWVHDARWSHDGKVALLTVGSCAEEVSPFDDPCPAPHFELVIADEKRVAFIAPGRRAAWTPVNALTPP